MSIIFFNSDIDECRIELPSPCRSASSIPSIKILPFTLGYFFAISTASDNGKSTLQYLETAFIDNGKQMFSSSTGGNSNSCSDDFISSSLSFPY